MKRRSTLLSAASAVLVLGVGLGAPAHAFASCLQLDLASITRTDTTAVFAGTVVREQAGHVFMRVDAWFLGAQPVASAEVVGGKASNDPGVITSVDWTPQAGERYLVVAERAAEQAFSTRPCQQVAVDPAVLQQASSVFGAPLQPPFAQPGGSVSPSGPAVGAPNGDPEATGSTQGSEASWLQPLAVGAALIAVAAVGLLGRALRRRRPSA